MTARCGGVAGAAASVRPVGTLAFIEVTGSGRYLVARDVAAGPGRALHAKVGRRSGPRPGTQLCRPRGSPSCAGRRTKGIVSIAAPAPRLWDIGNGIVGSGVSRKPRPHRVHEGASMPASQSPIRPERVLSFQGETEHEKLEQHPYKAPTFTTSSDGTRTSRGKESMTSTRNAWLRSKPRCGYWRPRSEFARSSRPVSRVQGLGVDLARDFLALHEVAVVLKHTITARERLLTIHRAREGLVFNSDGRKLHAAGCPSVGAMGLATRKLHFLSWDEARRELEALYGHEGSSWVRCPACIDDPIYGGSDREVPAQTLALRAIGARGHRDRRPRPKIGARPVFHEFAETLDTRPGVYLWSSEYIDYDDPPRPQDLEDVAQALRARLRGLQPSKGEMLHAVYAGPKGRDTDVENNLFYNVHTGGDSLRGATNGVRFEWWPDPLPGTLRGYSCHYAYRLVGGNEQFSHWQPVRELASWPSVNLGPLSTEKKLEPVWLALRSANAVDPSWPSRQPGNYFGLCLELLIPTGRASRNATLLKSVLDGVVCAFQHEPNRETAAVVAPRVADILRRLDIDLTPGDAVELLSSDDRAVLGPRAGLRSRTQWRPNDEDCVAVECRFGITTGLDYRLSGRVFIVAPVLGDVRLTST